MVNSSTYQIFLHTNLHVFYNMLLFNVFCLSSILSKGLEGKYFPQLSSSAGLLERDVRNVGCLCLEGI